MTDLKMPTTLDATMNFNKTLSVYIPILRNQVTEEQIMEVFNKLDIGKVSRVDFINKTNKNQMVRQAFVHFEYWYETMTSIVLQQRILDTSINARLVYDDPYFWPLLPTHNPAPEQPEYAKETNIITMEIMQKRINNLEKSVQKLNIQQTIQNDTISQLYNNLSYNNAHIQTVHDSWVNLSEALNSQSISNKRQKPRVYTACQNLYESVVPNSASQENQDQTNTETMELDSLTLAPHSIPRNAYSTPTLDIHTQSSTLPRNAYSSPILQTLKSELNTDPPRVTRQYAFTSEMPVVESNIHSDMVQTPINQQLDFSSENLEFPRTQSSMAPAFINPPPPSPITSYSMPNIPDAVQRINPSCCGQVSDAWIPDFPPFKDEKTE